MPAPPSRIVTLDELGLSERLKASRPESEPSPPEGGAPPPDFGAPPPAPESPPPAPETSPPSAEPPSPEPAPPYLVGPPEPDPPPAFETSPPPAEPPSESEAPPFSLSPVPDPEPEPSSTTEVEPEPESESEPAIKFVLPPPPPEPKPVPGLESNFATAEPTPDPDPPREPEREPDPDPEPEPEPAAIEFVLPPAPEPEPEPVHDAYAHTEPDPVHEPAPEPVYEPYAQTAAEPVAEWQPPAEPEPYAQPVEEPPQAEAERPDRLAALRDLARKLRSAPEAEATLQFIIEISCRCTGSHAGMLTITVPENRQVVWGTALGAGPYISVQLRAGGPSFGELVLTRMADAPEFENEDETFAELVGEYVAKAVSSMRRGTVLSDEQQDFIDRVTEELRSPLAGAVNLLDTVVTGEASEEESAAYLERSTSDVRRMLRLIDDLIHIARLRPPEPREMEAMPVGPWLRRAVEAARPRAEAAGHRLELSEPSGAYVVNGVPALLDVVLHHLLDNAIKFSEQPGPIDVSAVPSEGMLRICVADQGIGFDGGDAARMLDCFSRAINAEAARIPGTGVGLFLASEVVKGHGGRIWLDSRRDEGTQAYVALPYEG